MNIIYVDDEQASVLKFKMSCPEAVAFQAPKEALAYAKEKRIDLAFLDVEMPELNGIELARLLRNINPNTKIVFLTAYDTHALAAYEVEAIGYLLKPYRKDAVMKQIEKASRIADIPEQKVNIRTMPHFEVFVDGKRLEFKSGKAKELLALLVDNRGSPVNNDYAITYLWENRKFDENVKTLYRMTKKSLKDFLENTGISFIIEDGGRTLAVNKDSFNCDYYELLEGDNAAKAAFHGEYMFEYSWAEKSAANIEAMLKKRGGV